MAPFEPCGKLPNGQARRKLTEALQAAENRETRGEAEIVAAYRKTDASRKHYPNTGELWAEMSGRDRLSGGITEVCAKKHRKLVEAWSDLGVTPVNSSWRSEVHPGRVLSCPATLHAPWLFSADPMTFREVGCADDDKPDDKLYRKDLPHLATALKGFVASGQPGVEALFVYGVGPKVRPQFWTFAHRLAASCAMSSMVSCWMTHQGGNHDLAALLCSGVVLPDGWLPCGVHLIE
jgi:hypothetical protein